MEAELDVLCLVADVEKKRILQEFLQDEARPLLVSQVADEHKERFTILDNLSSIESSKFVGEDGLALSWFIGGGDWFTETELTLKDLYRAGADKIAAVLWLDGQIETVFKISDSANVEIVDDLDEDLLDKFANDEEVEGDIFDYLRSVLKP